MCSIFLSHSTKDKQFAKRLALRLQEKGVQVWIDDEKIKVGESIVAKLGEALDSVDFVGALVSEHSVSSKWVSHEIQVAIAKEIESSRPVVLPLLIGDVKMPTCLKDKKYADFRAVESFDAEFSHLLMALGVAVQSPEDGHHFRSHYRILRRVTVDFSSASDETNVDEHSPPALFGMLSSLRNRVLMFWHDSVMTLEDCLRLTTQLSVDGIPANYFEHADFRGPDAVFVARDCHPWLVKRVLRRLSYRPRFIFPYDYRSKECGGPSDFVMSLGLRSSYHNYLDDSAMRPRPLPETDWRTLTASQSSDRMIMSTLNKLAG